MMSGILIANFVVASLMTALYVYMKYRKGWFNHDHLRVPAWMTVLSVPLGLLIPISRLSIDGMLIVAVIFFGNEWIYQRWGVSPLGWLISCFDRKVKDGLKDRGIDVDLDLSSNTQSK